MFRNARNVQISGGQYNVQNNTTHKSGGDGIDILRDNIASGATHDSGERFDPPKCNAGTRVAIIQTIMAWVLEDSDESSSMLWLRGSAGIGKSSLAQSISELCSKEGCLAATFFFSRTVHERGDGRLLIPTLSYQLTSTIPGTRSIIKRTVEQDPLVLQRTIEVQMEHLFIKPINDGKRFRMWRYVVPFTRSRPRLVVIDGLDECSDTAAQCEILRVLSGALQHLRFPFRILIASRPEAHLTRSINELRPSTLLREINLSEDSWQADSDILTFLVGGFDKVRKTHPLQLYLPSPWPTDEDIRELVRRSSGHFIYASVVMRYITSPKHRPVERLNIILGLSPRPVKDFPFAQLDELYSYILGCAEDTETVLLVLGILIIPRSYNDRMGNYSTPRMLEELLGLQPGDIELLLNDLLSIITIVSPTEPIRILHASLADFLRDRSRADKFYVDIMLSHTALARGYMKVAVAMDESTEKHWDPIIAHLKKAILTEALHRDLLSFSFLGIFTNLKSLRQSRSVDVRYVWEWTTAFIDCFHCNSPIFDCEPSQGIYSHLLRVFDVFLNPRLFSVKHDDEFMDILTLLTVRSNSHKDSHIPMTRYTDTNKPLWGGAEITNFVHSQLSQSLSADDYQLYFKGIAPVRFSAREKILMHLCQFLLDPKRSGEYFIDGAKYARATLRYFKQLHQMGIFSCAPPPKITDKRLASCQNAKALLSKAATTRELVAFLTDNVIEDINSSLKLTYDTDLVSLLTEIQIYLKCARITYPPPTTEW